MVLASACGDNINRAGDDGGVDDAITCTAPELRCGLACVDVQTDEANCGTCGNACAAGQVCSAGACEAQVTCTAPEVDCDNTCVDTQTDEANCGGCGSACTASQTCVAGTCETSVSCPAPEVSCENVCKDTQTDEEHCGTCGNACESTETCVAGTCQTTVSCTTPEVICNNQCKNTQTDEDHCGACGAPCASTETCIAGLCETTVSCSFPEMNCNNVCTNTQTDEGNCGTCGSACASTETCLAGICEPTATCTFPEEACNNVCKDTQTDEQNCGGCGIPCAITETCITGVCETTVTCTDPEEDCNNVCVNTTTDLDNCGACNSPCTGGDVCNNGTCGPACVLPSVLCGSACVDAQTNEQHCGTCGNACDFGEVCTGGTCACPAGTTDCNGTCVDTTTNDSNCGGCGPAFACAANENCVGGVCELDCTAPFADCGGTACVNTDTDDANCGQCGLDCSTVSQFHGCQGGVCVLECPQGTSPCDGTCVNTQTDPDNCGGCGSSNPIFDCDPGELCSAGTCQLDCQGGTTLCNGLCVDLTSDEGSCGMCGLACPLGASCIGGACECPAGIPNACPTVCTNFNSDPGNCGDCGITCDSGAGETCSSGLCCPAGQTNCSGVCKDLTDEATCGSCTNACGAGESCTNGVCECPYGQDACNGECIITSVDPANCGTCGNVCGVGANAGLPFCVSNGCTASCPSPLSACTANGESSCVNRLSDSDNCGTCGNQCAAGFGCVQGTCIDAIDVGPDPAKCVNGGPPIVVPTGPGETECTGSLGGVTFRFGLCSCTNVGPLGHQLLVDGFDSSQGPYSPTVPARLGGGIGVNGTIQSTAAINAFGDLWVFGAQGQTTKGEVIVHQRFFNKGKLAYSGLVSIDETSTAGGEDAMIGGEITKGGGNHVATVSGQLTTGTTACNALPVNFTTGSCVEAPFDTALEDPCDCAADQLIPVRQIVQHFSNPANNDNALIGLSTSALVAPGGPSRLDLPCGNYYLDQINTAGATTIFVHGRTGIYVGGSMVVSQELTIDLAPDATLDIFVAGVLKTSQTLTIGNPAYPRLSRLYFGSSGCKGNGTCTSNADCCSGVCSGGVCGGGGGGNISETVSLSGPSNLNGLLYAGYGTVRVTNPLEMNGAIFANYYDASTPTTIHFDKGAVLNGEECPPPPPNSGCESCRDCDNQACVDGQCGACTLDSECCAPLRCIGGSCSL